MTLSDIRLRTMLVFATSALFMWILSPVGFSQSANGPLPKVGTIKDYPATGLMTGCGNLYFYKAADANSGTDNYVFLSRGDGGNAWMNLNGRDVRLLQIKSRHQKFSRYSYLYRNVRITVEIDEFTPKPGAAEHTSKMKITFRKGRAVRVVHAVGGSDC